MCGLWNANANKKNTNQSINVHGSYTLVHSKQASTIFKKLAQKSNFIRDFNTANRFLNKENEVTIGSHHTKH